MDKAMAIYLRLSVADGDLGKDNKDISNSIENQRQLLLSYIDDHEDLSGEVRQYIDDGYTGTNFNRPSFQNMVEDARAGEIRCVIVKDLSRLGRDYIGVGDYVEQIFPMLGVRFISVNDNIDSDALERSGAMLGIDFAVTNLVNNLYSYDVSKKIRSAYGVKWRQGIATNSTVPFGYLWDSTHPQRWVIDPVASNYVRRIFELAIQGNNTRMIAFKMNAENIPTPAVYAQMTRKNIIDSTVSPDSEKKWDFNMVGGILKRYEYTGALVANRYRYIGLGKRVKRKRNEKDWIVAENAHEAIVTHEEYDEAQSAIRSISPKSYESAKEYPLRGVLRCGNCRRMLKYSYRAGEGWFYCYHKRDVGQFSKCYIGYYREALINANVAYAIRNMVDTIRLIDGTKHSAAEDPKSVEMKIPDEDKLRKKIDVLKEERIRQYESYADGTISKESYLKKKQELTEEIEQIQTEIQRIEELMSKQDEERGPLKEIADQAANMEMTGGLSSAMVEAFIEVVYLYEGDRMEIVFKHNDELKEAADKFLTEAGMYQDEDGIWVYPGTDMNGGDRDETA